MLNKKDVFARWKKHGIKYKIAVGSCLVLAFLAVPLLILAVIIALITRANFAAVWSNKLLWGLYAGAELAIILFALFEYRTLGSRRVKKVNFDLENSRFMERYEIERNDGFTVTNFEGLKDVKDGLLIWAERKGKQMDMDIVLHNPIHAMIIATTGTGKTSTYVSPFVEVVSRTSTKPCMVITDPKGELYARHANTLKKNGYNVHIIDFADTYHSTLWNPFNDVWKKTERITEPVIQVKNKYQWGGRLFSTYAEASQTKKEYAVRLNNEIYIDLMDLIYTACPVEAAQDKSWQQGARDLIFGMALRMWEDVRDGYLPKEKFNIYNLWWNLTQYAKNDCEVLKEYINDCADDTSRAPGMANTVLVSEDRTLSSYLGSVNQYLHMFSDGAITQLTSGNDIDFSNWDEEPNVLFIKYPEDKETRHGMVALLMVQLYKALLEKAGVNSELNETSDSKLKRTCYFLMDEFGQLPKIHRFELIVPIARSKRIFFLPVIQSYTQLDAVYGEKNAGTIKDNCPIKIFLGTDNPKTCDEFSNACGKQKIKSVSYNENKDMSVSTSAQSVPLIYPSELSKLNDPDNGVFGNAIIKDVKLFPIRAHTTPYFKAMDVYGIEDGAEAPKRPFFIFKETENRYDVTRLIYLNHALNDETPELMTVEQRADMLTQQVAEETITQMAMKNLKKKAAAKMNELKSLVSEADFLRLAVASSAEKVRILDELAEQAIAEGKPALAIRLEEMISFFKYNITELDAEVQSEVTDEKFNG